MRLVAECTRSSCSMALSSPSSSLHFQYVAMRLSAQLQPADMSFLQRKPVRNVIRLQACFYSRTINIACSSKSLACTQNLRGIPSVDLRNALVLPIYGSSKGLSIFRCIRYVGVVKLNTSSLDDRNRYVVILGKTIGNHKTGCSAANNYIVVSWAVFPSVICICRHC